MKFRFQSTSYPDWVHWNCEGHRGVVRRNGQPLEVDPADWELLFHVLDLLDAWTLWESKYVDKGIMDGGEWWLTVDRGSQHLSVSAHNLTPPGYYAFHLALARLVPDERYPSTPWERSEIEALALRAGKALRREGSLEERLRDVTDPDLDLPAEYRSDLPPALFAQATQGWREAEPERRGRWLNVLFSLAHRFDPTDLAARAAYLEVLEELRQLCRQEPYYSAGLLKPAALLASTEPAAAACLWELVQGDGSGRELIPSLPGWDRELLGRLPLPHSRVWIQLLLEHHPEHAPTVARLAMQQPRGEAVEWLLRCGQDAEPFVAQVLAWGNQDLALRHRILRLPLGTGAGAHVARWISQGDAEALKAWRKVGLPAATVVTPLLEQLEQGQDPRAAARALLPLAGEHGAWILPVVSRLLEAGARAGSARVEPALELAEALGAPAVLGLLLVTSSPLARVRTLAVEVLSRLHSREALPRFQELAAGDPDLAVRVAAFRAWLQLEPERAPEFLEQSLSRLERPAQRSIDELMEMAQRLQALGPERARGALEPLREVYRQVANHRLTPVVADLIKGLEES